MSSPFICGTVVEQTKEQRKLSRQAWKPNSLRQKMQKPSPVTIIFRNEKVAAV